MNVLLLTSNPDGIAARWLARGAEPLAVILDEGRPDDRLRAARKRLRKLRRIGIGGALAGLALRRLYDVPGSFPPIDQHTAPVYRVPSHNSDEARRLLRELAPDVAVSLDCRLLRPETFTIPALGTINVHHGAVPEYRGGPPIFWELRDGRDRVGYTVHGIDAGIDTGPVYARGDVPIDRRSTLAQTLAATLPRLHDASLDALGATLTALAADEAVAEAQPSHGRLRTTPRLADLLAVRRALSA